MPESAPCGQKAKWIVISDVLDGGEGFVATCRDCYKRTRKFLPENADDLVPASVFIEDYGREPMCGEDDNSPALALAIREATERVSTHPMVAKLDRRDLEEATEAPTTHLEFSRFEVKREIKAHVHRIAIERRFDRLEDWAGRLTMVVAGAAAFYVANRFSRALHREPEDWVWYGVFLCVGLVAARWIHLGRFRKRLKIK